MTDEALSSPDTLHEKIMKEMSQDEFTKEYLRAKEANWSVLPISSLEAIDREVRRRGLRNHLLDQIGEVVLSHERWLTRRYEEDKASTPSASTTSTSESESSDDSPVPTNPATGQPYTKAEAKEVWENAKRQLMPVARMLGLARNLTQEDFALVPLPESSFSDVTDPVRLPNVAARNETGQPSFEESSGAATGVAGAYEIVAYRRLPLQGKRDAFLADGFLYVRARVLRGWVMRLTDGRCCRPASERLGHHSSDCWVGNAVR